MLQVLIALTFIFGMLGPASLPARADLAKAQPLLAQLAAEEPDQQVSVIVQKSASGAGLEARVAQLGGEVTRDLHIINAFAAKLPAGAALVLAQDPGVRWVSLDAAMERSGKPDKGGKGGGSTTTSPQNYYLDTLGVREVWNMGIRRQGITVAVIDSGITPDQDFTQAGDRNYSYTESPRPLDANDTSRLITRISFNPNSTTVNDVFGHGTHVAGIIGGNGYNSQAAYTGVAPEVNLSSLKVSDEAGMAYESDVVAAMQWVYDNRALYNIRVVNVSLNSTAEIPYHYSPLDAAAEILWFNGVVVVASSGNSDGSNWNYANAAPANDPFIITVGAADEKGTANTSDDEIAPYTAWTLSGDYHFKPDIYAPGTNIISVLSSQSDWNDIAPERVVLNNYFRLSGTSMAAPMVTGAAALLLQDEPNLTPDQVKYRLLHSTTHPLEKRVGAITFSLPYLDVYAAINGTTTASANTGVTASQLLWSGSEPVTWGSVAWNSVAWNSVAWNSVAWNSVYWGP